MKHTIEHGLAFDVACSAARHASESCAERFEGYNFSATWVDAGHVEFGFTVAGKRLSGSMKIDAEVMVLEIPLPFVLKPFRRKAIDVIDAEVREWIARAKRGEMD